MEEGGVAVRGEVRKGGFSQVSFVGFGFHWVLLRGFFGILSFGSTFLPAKTIICFSLSHD